MTRFYVNRPLVWDGIEYFTGDTVEIEDNHPRLRPLVEQSKHLSYDDREPPLGPTSPLKFVMEVEKRRRQKELAEQEQAKAKSATIDKIRDEYLESLEL